MKKLTAIISVLTATAILAGCTAASSTSESQSEINMAAQSTSQIITASSDSAAEMPIPLPDSQSTTAESAPTTSDPTATSMPQSDMTTAVENTNEAQSNSLLTETEMLDSVEIIGDESAVIQGFPGEGAIPAADLPVTE